MQIWPESATLSEDGGVAPGVGGGVSGGGSAGGNMPGMGPGMAAAMKAPNAGEILLSRAESIALAALETETDEDFAFKRARAESGLDDKQLKRLKSRAENAVAKGYTLKGTHLVKRPQAPTMGEEPSLARKAATPKKEENAGEHPMRRKEDKEALKAKKAKGPAVVTRRAQEHDSLYTCPARDDYGYPTPQSDNEPDSGDDAQKEANTMTTLATMLRRATRRRKER